MIFLDVHFQHFNGAVSWIMPSSFSLVLTDFFRNILLFFFYFSPSQYQFLRLYSVRTMRRNLNWIKRSWIFTQIPGSFFTNPIGLYATLRFFKYALIVWADFKLYNHWSRIYLSNPVVPIVIDQQMHPQRLAIYSPIQKTTTS